MFVRSQDGTWVNLALVREFAVNGTSIVTEYGTDGEDGLVFATGFASEQEAQGFLNAMMFELEVADMVRVFRPQFPQ